MITNVGIKGFLSWAVLNKNKKIISYNKIKTPNLITKFGLNSVATQSFASNFNVCKLGSGNTAATINDLSLENEIIQTNDHLDGLCGYSSGSNFVNLFRTFETSPFISTETIREVGFSSSSLANLFSRIITEDILVFSGNTIVIRYDLVITFSPDLPSPYETPSFLSSVIGNLGFQSIGLVGITSNGLTDFTDSSNGSNEPSVQSRGFFSDSSLGFASLFSSNDRSGSNNIVDTVSLSTYRNDSYFREKFVSFNFTSPTTVRSVGVGTPQNQGALFLFDNDIVVNGPITLKFKYRWGESFFEFRPLSYWRDPEENDLFFKNPILNYFDLN